MLKESYIKVNEDHIHDLETQRFLTGALLWLDDALQKCYSIRTSQAVKISMYCSEFVTALICMKMAIKY